MRTAFRAISVAALLTTAAWAVGSSQAPYIVITRYPVTGDPWGITSGPNNTLWFTERSAGMIGRITLTNGTPEITYFNPGEVQPVAITLGADNALWFTDFLGGNIGRILPSGMSTLYPTDSSQSGPYGITSSPAPDSAVYFTEFLFNEIGRITPPDSGGQTSQTYYQVPTEGGNATAITIGPDGAVWFLVPNQGLLGRLPTPAQNQGNTIVTSPVMGPLSTSPFALASGPSGTLWFTEAGAVGYETVLGDPIFPVMGGANGGITQGPDNAMWFPENNYLGHILTDGTLTEYPVSGAAPGDITVGPDGALWFTDLTGAIFRAAIAPPLQITNTSLPNGVVGIPYPTTTLQASGTPPFQFSASNLPPGLTLSPAGVLSGTPTTPGTYSVSVTVLDSATPPPGAPPNQTTVTYQVLIFPVGFNTGCSAVPGLVGSPYSFQPQLQGTYTWQLIAGSLPPGLVLNPQTGVISGTPTTPGNFPFTLTATQVNSSRNGGSPIPLQCSISVTAPAPPLSVTCPAFSGAQGTPFTGFLDATGGLGSYSWMIVRGSLPAGLSLFGSEITGTPGGPAGTSGFTVEVRSGNQTADVNCSFTVTTPSLQLTSSCPTPGIQGVPYGPVALTASGGSGNYTFMIVSGSLPGGLQLNNGVISGTPTGPPGPSAPFGIEVSSGGQVAFVAPCSITISAGLSVSGVCPASAMLNAPLSVPVTLSGGVPPIHAVLTGPSWLNYANSAISGTPPAAGLTTFTLTVTDSGNSAPQRLTCTFPVSSGPLQVTGSCPTGAIGVNSAFSLPLSAVGGTGNYRWTISGPSFLTLSSASGTTLNVVGTPPATGTFPFTVTLNDDGGTAAASFNCSVTVVQPLVITPVESGGGPVSGCPASLPFQSAYSITLNASGGVPPYTWTLNGPSWLSLSNTTGASSTVSGTAPGAGTFPFTVTLSDSAGTAVVAYTCSLVINQPAIPAITLTLGTSSGNSLAPIAVTLTLASASPVTLTGTVGVTFTPNATNPTPNPQVHFSDPCQNSCSFTIPVGATSVALPNLEVGNEAGTIHIALTALSDSGRNVLPSPAPSADVTVPQLAPVITSMTVENKTATSFDVVLAGYSTPRDLKSLNISFTGANGVTLQGNTSFTLDLTGQSSKYYQEAATSISGGTFAGLRVSVTTTGTPNAIGSVTVSLTNSVGQSATMTVTP